MTVGFYCGCVDAAQIFCNCQVNSLGILGAFVTIKEGLTLSIFLQKLQERYV